MTSGAWQPLPPEPDTPRPRILIVDDDPLLRRMVCQTLGNAYQVIEAENGRAGLEMADRLHPDLILLDVMMSGMDGFQVCYQLRRNPATSHLPVVMLTALGDMNEKLHGMQIGADDYITKPFDPRELRARVEAHLRRSARDQQASPLTLLPGNTAIEQVLRIRLESKAQIAVLYTDLANFKMFNDKYGWVAGDQVIKWLGRMIVEVVQALGDKDAFVGHIGGDDLVVLTTPQYGERVAQGIIHRFEREIGGFYAPEDREAGYITGVDRQGNQVRVPLMTLSVAVVTNENRELSHPLQVAQIAAEVKAFAKTLEGSQYVVDRRRG